MTINTITLENNMYPKSIKTNSYKYIEIDGVLYSSIVIVDYPREHKGPLLDKLLHSQDDYIISIFTEKQDRQKVIKELNYSIGNVSVEMENINIGNHNSDIAEYTLNDAKYIRKEMIINNEDLFCVYIYCTVYAKTKKELKLKLQKLEALLRMEGLVPKKTYFRQEQAFQCCLPIAQNNPDLKGPARRNILGNSIAGIYPFITNRIVDKNGILLGLDENNSMIIVNRFNQDKYRNANMLILGASGSGKSYFTKVQIARTACYDVDQYIIDPDREYTTLCKNLGRRSYKNWTIIKDKNQCNGHQKRKSRRRTSRLFKFKIRKDNGIL